MNGLNTINDIPKAWRAALTSIQSLFPMAVMAGGCLRDRDHGVAVKDIDIFLPSPLDRMEDAEHVRDALVRAGWLDVKLVHDDTYMGIGSGRMIASINTRFPNCPPIQINVGGWNMSQLAEEMDFGICQISFDGREIRRTVAYTADVRAKHFRVRVECDDNRFVRSVNRWARLKEKYPNHEFHMGTRSADLHVGGVRGSTLTVRLDEELLKQRYYSPTARAAVTQPNLQQLPRQSSLADSSGAVIHHPTVGGRYG